jgi:hypothetical protein
LLMTTSSKELWNDLNTARTNCVELLRRLTAEGHLNPIAEHSASKLLRIEHDIGVAIGEASIREAAELQDLRDERDEDEYLANLGAL